MLKLLQSAASWNIIISKEMILVNKSLGATLHSLRRAAGLTQQRVTELLRERGYEVQSAAVSKWEKDMTMPNAGQFLALCEIYSVSDVMGTFTGKNGPTALLNDAGRKLVDDYITVLVASGLYSGMPGYRQRTLPLYDLAASAGTGQFLDGESYKLIDASDAPRRADFAVRIAGDSMEPEIHDGSVVWVHGCETLSSGRIGIFVYGGQAYCKRLRVNSAGVMLISANMDYAPIVVREEGELRVCGEVVGAAVPR